MDPPSYLDIQLLINKLTDNASLTSADVSVVDRANGMSQTTQVANSINHIYHLLAQCPQKQFWQSFTSIINYSQHDYTRFLTYTILQKRIRRQWHSYDQSIHQGLSRYVVQNIQKYLEEGNGKFLLALNQILVTILRFEKNSLFKDFVSSLESQGINLPINKLNNNLNILKILLSEGFDLKDEIVSPSQTQQFATSLNRDMRTILRVFCLYLTSDGVNRHNLINKCLQTLKVSLQHIPAFEIFNCNLMEILAGLIEKLQIHSSLIICLQEIFKFKECSTTNNSHSKIVSKLLLILQTYLKVFESGKRFQDNEMDNASTQDSFGSSKTQAKKKHKSSQKYFAILNLTYEFLIRYVPFMDKAKGEQDLQIQYQKNIKLYFSRDLYNSFALIYWKLIIFLQFILETLDPFQNEEHDAKNMEQRMKAICCARLMIIMLNKLKLEPKEQIQILIQTTIINFTPLLPQFAPYYLQFDLLQDGLQVATELPFFSTDIQEEYKEFMCAVLQEKSIAQMYFHIVQSRIQNNEMYEIGEKDRQSIRMQLMQSKQLQRYATLKTINSINRVCWSTIYAYQSNYEAVKQLPIQKIALTLTKSTQLYQSLQLQRCCSLNSKFLSQIYYPNSTLYEALYSTLQMTKNESVIQFTLLLLSKIFMNEHVNCNLQVQELKVIIQKLHDIQNVDVGAQNLAVMYPAIVNFLIRKMQQTNEKQKSVKYREVMEALIKMEIQSLHEFGLARDDRDQPLLQKSIIMFKKMKKISQHLACIFKPKKIIKNSSGIIGWLRLAAKCAISDFLFKYQMFSNHLKEVEREYFDILHTIEFRKQYVELSRIIIVIYMALNYNQSKQLKAANKWRKDLIVFINHLEEKLRADFINQQQFKVKEFLQFEIDFYQYVMLAQPGTCQEIINCSISQILNCLDGWSMDEDVVIQRYKFMKDVVRIFGMKLSQQNIIFLCSFFKQFQRDNIQTASIELILQLFYQFFTLIIEDCNKTSKKMVFEQFTSLLIIIFQNLFCSTSQREPIFSKVANLLYMQIEIASCVHPLQMGKKDNTEILYFALREHISSKIHIPCEEEHSSKLSLIFTIKKYEHWMIALREYVVYVRKIANQ